MKSRPYTDASSRFVYTGCPDRGDEHSEQCISYNCHRGLFSGFGTNTVHLRV